MKRERIAGALFALLAFMVPVAAGAQQAAPPAGDIVASGSLSYLNATQSVSVNGESTCTVSVAGTWAGTLTFEGTSNATDWYAIPMTPYAGGTASSSTTTTGLWYTQCAGLQSYRVRFSTYTSGSAAITLRSSMGVAFQAGGGSALLTSANTWTQTQTSSANVAWAYQNGTNAACPGAGTPAGGTATIASEYGNLCFGPVAPTTALVIGKTCGSSWNTGTAACNSGAITWAIGTNGADKICSLYASSGTSGFVTTGTAACPFTFNGTLDTGSNPILRVTYMTQSAANNFAGTCTEAAATSCTLTLGHSYTTTVCTTGDNTNATAVKWAVSGAVVTLSTPAAASDTLSVICTGNPS